MAHWCTILSTCPKSVAGSTQAFTTINKSFVEIVQWITSLSEELGPHMLRSTGIYTYTHKHNIERDADR